MLRSIKPIPLIGISPNDISLDLPRFSWVNPCDLLVEDEYQRKLTRLSITMIRKIANNFDWLHIKPPVCSQAPNGKLFVIDGQHTAIAAASRGVKKIPIMIVNAVSTEIRARAFVAHNTDRLQVTPMQLFHSRVAARDKTAVLVKRVCSDAGVTMCRVQPATGRWRVGETVAVGSVEKIVVRLGEEKAVRVFKVLVAAGRAPIMQHELSAVQEILYGQSPYEGAVFNLVTVIRSKDTKEWISKVSRKQAETGEKLWKLIAETWLNSLR
jgi:hypothetical protein